jgi:hypothetical protein
VTEFCAESCILHRASKPLVGLGMICHSGTTRKLVGRPCMPPSACSAKLGATCSPLTPCLVLYVRTIKKCGHDVGDSPGSARWVGGFLKLLMVLMHCS